jgi:hypothetical protein
MESCSPSWEACTSFLYVVLHAVCILLMQVNSYELSFFFVSHRLTHNWWHVAVCYLEAESPLCKVLEIYDHNIMKELEKSDCETAEVLCLLLVILL